MALDGTSYPHLRTAHLPGRMCPCCPCECHLTDLEILRLKQAQVGRHHVTGAQDHLGAGRRRMAQDGAGWRRMVKSMSEFFCSAVHQYHEAP